MQAEKIKCVRRGAKARHGGCGLTTKAAAWNLLFYFEEKKWSNIRKFEEFVVSVKFAFSFFVNFFFSYKIPSRVVVQVFQVFDKDILEEA